MESKKSTKIFIDLPDTITPYDYADWRGIGENKAREIFRARIMELAKEGKNATEILEILKSENIIPKSLIGEQIIYQISYYYNKAKNEKGYENDR